MMDIGKNSIIADTAQIGQDVVIGNHVCIKENAVIGDHTKICDGSVICADSVIGEQSYIDFYAVIREKVRIGRRGFVGTQCILGEYLADFMDSRDVQNHETQIGDQAVIRSGTIIYGGTTIGDNFQTGHRVTIREKSMIGKNVRVGTLSDIQGNCQIGNYVNMHSSVHIGMASVIKDYVWIYPYTVLTNDPNPPSEKLIGVTVEEYAVIATGTVVLPGVIIGQDALVGAGAVVNKDVREGTVVVGSPAREKGRTVDIKNRTTGEASYPWRYFFERGMPWAGIGYEEWSRQ